VRRASGYWCLVICLAVAGATAANPTSTGTLVYIGTQGGQILSARLDPVSGRITALARAAAVPHPTWIDGDVPGRRLFAISDLEGRGGEVHDFAVELASGKLTAISRRSSGGSGPAYLAFAASSSTLFVANFGGGEVAALPVTVRGGIGDPASVQVDQGSGPLENQKSAHAHATVLDPSGRWLVVPDMGADKVFVFRFDPNSRALTPAPTPFVATGAGTGPRHLVFSRSGRFAYLVTELSAEIRVFRWDATAGILVPIQACALDPVEAATHSAAEIALSPNGRFLYTSNRARNLIQVFRIGSGSGQLSPLEDVPSGGQVPRSFGIEPHGRWMLVGNQNSRTISVFAIDSRSGRLSLRGDPVAVEENPMSFTFFEAAVGKSR